MPCLAALVAHSSPTNTWHTRTRAIPRVACQARAQRRISDTQAQAQRHSLGIATVAFASATGATRLLRILQILTIQLRVGPHPRECQLRVRLAINAPSVLYVIHTPTPTPTHTHTHNIKEVNTHISSMCVCACCLRTEKETGKERTGGRARERGGMDESKRASERGSADGRES